MLDRIKEMGNLFIEIGNVLVNYQLEDKISLDSSSQLISMANVLKMHPFLSKYILTKAINDGTLSVTRIGRNRYFYLNDIKNFLKSQQNRSEQKEKLENWRSN